MPTGIRDPGARNSVDGRIGTTLQVILHKTPTGEWRSSQGPRPARAYHRPLPPLYCMSQTPSPANSHSSYRSIFDSALESYKKKTGKDLISDPLFRRLETCHSPDDILVILREHISGFDHPHNSSDGLSTCLNTTVNVLYSFSAIIGAGPGLVSLTKLGFAAV